MCLSRRFPKFEGQFCDLAAASEPNSLVLLHILNHLFQSLRTTRSARNVRVDLERAKGRSVFRLLVELVEKSLPNHEGVIRVAGISVCIDSAVTEGCLGSSARIPWSFSQTKGRS